MITRRRFLSIAASTLATPARSAEPLEWRGHVLGSTARIVLAGAAPNHATKVFSHVEAILRHVERQFSLHRDSDLTRLNRDGWLSRPGDHFLEVCNLANAVHHATDGLFDPTIQPLWLATAAGEDTKASSALIGWNKVRCSTSEIRIAYRMQLTFNGIAQGHAADRVASLMRDEGFQNVLIDLGEIQALGQRPGGGGWRADIALPDGQSMAHATLSDRALATSSPAGTLIGGGKSHIIHPFGGEPEWQLASVSAPQAALADALSTAFCLMDRGSIAKALAAFPDARLEALA